MKEKRRLEFFWETHEITTINFKHGFSAKFFCRMCRAETLYLTVSEAALILKFSELGIFHFVEIGQIHSIETAAGTMLVCGNSMAAINAAADKTDIVPDKTGGF